MDRDALIKQLIFLHENDEHQHIIDTIENIPRRKWDFEISGLYSRALNNLGRYEDAMDQLFMYQEEGRKDSVWHFRVGFSLYFLNFEAEAADYFQRAIDLGDDSDDTKELLRRSILETDMNTSLMDGITLLEGGERNIEKIQKQFDQIMKEINNCRKSHYGDDAYIKKTVKNIISKRVEAVVKYFDLDIAVETLIEELDV